MRQKARDGIVNHRNFSLERRYTLTRKIFAKVAVRPRPVDNLSRGQYPRPIG